MLNGILNGSLLAPSAALLGEHAITTVPQDYFFLQMAGTLRISGLDRSTRYVFHLFGSRELSSANGRTITGIVLMINNRWHKLVVTYYYARGTTMLYINIVREGTVSERLRPIRFDLGATRRWPACSTAICFSTTRA